MTDLYTMDEARRMKKRADFGRAAALALALISTAACAVLCFFVNTQNAHALFAAVLMVFTLGGWAAIVINRLISRPARAEAAHMQGILAGEREEMEGEITLQKNVLQIPKSIQVQKVHLKNESGTVLLNVDARLSSRLPGNGKRVRLWCVRKYIAAFEVLP